MFLVEKSISSSSPFKSTTKKSSSSHLSKSYQLAAISLDQKISHHLKTIHATSSSSSSISLTYLSSLILFLTSLHIECEYQISNVNETDVDEMHSLIMLSPYASSLPLILSLLLYMECDDSDGHTERATIAMGGVQSRYWGLKVSSVFVLMEDLSLPRDALFLRIDSSTQMIFARFHQDKGLVFQSYMSMNRMYPLCEEIKELPEQSTESFNDHVRKDSLVGKQTRKNITKSSSWRANDVLELVHSDIYSPIFPPSNTRKRYLRDMTKESGDTSKKEVGTTSTPQFQCPILKPSNYSLWAIRMQIILEANGLWEMIEPLETTQSNNKKDKTAIAFFESILHVRTIASKNKNKNAESHMDAPENRHIGEERELATSSVANLKSDF
ncbi:zinc finger, CCHC-type containing protein [Tanacetum coccineum]